MVVQAGCFHRGDKRHHKHTFVLCFVADLAGFFSGGEVLANGKLTPSSTGDFYVPRIAMVACVGGCSGYTFDCI